MKLSRSIPWIRWLARGLGGIASGIFLSAAVVSGLGSEPIPLPMLLLLMLAITGSLVALRWEKLGGMISLIGAFALGTFVYTHAGHRQLEAAAIYSLPFLITGLLFLISSSKPNHHPQRDERKPSS